MILAVLGLMIMVSSSDMLSFYMGLEMQSLAAYVIAAAKKGDKRTAEAGIKYFILGALASGILLYGISLIYGYTGATNFADIGTSVNANETLPLGVTIGLVLVIIGIAFKLSAAPFHMWAPDVYDGVATPVTAFFAVVPKLAAVAVLIRILATSFDKFMPEWQQVIIIISVLSMLVGAFAGIWQQSIKRLLAYSSIGHMGYILAGVAALGVEGTGAVLSYFVIYILNTIGIFAIILFINARDKESERNIKNIGHFAGFYKTHPAIAILFTLMLVSMIGLPILPFAGFWAKFLVFSAAVNSGLYALAVIGVVSSVVASYYYLRIIKIMYFDEPVTEIKIFCNNDKNIKAALLLVTILSLVIFIKPSLLTNAAKIAASSLF
jgi:NADH-quinone oxidoreductase subunit N